MCGTRAFTWVLVCSLVTVSPSFSGKVVNICFAVVWLLVHCPMALGNGYHSAQRWYVNRQFPLFRIQSESFFFLTLGPFCSLPL